MFVLQQSEKHVNKVRHNMAVNCVECLPGGGGFASAGEDGLVKLFRFPTRCVFHVK